MVTSIQFVMMRTRVERLLSVIALSGIVAMKLLMYVRSYGDREWFRNGSLRSRIS